LRFKFIYLMKNVFVFIVVVLCCYSAVGQVTYRPHN
jgi:hypothetical protein